MTLISPCRPKLGLANILCKKNYKICISQIFDGSVGFKLESELVSLILAKDFFQKILIRKDIPHFFIDDI